MPIGIRTSVRILGANLKTFVLKTSLLFMALLLAAGCSRELEDNNQLQIRLPGNSSSPKLTSTKSSKVGTLAAIGWGIAAPTSNTEIVCYAVMISNPNLPAFDCTDNQGLVVKRPSVFRGLYPAGSTITLDNMPGGPSSIHLLGFAASSTTACGKLSSTIGPNYNALSEPIIVSEKNIDIQNGDNFVDMVVPSSLTGLSSVNQCQKFLTTGGATGPKVVSASLPSATYSAGSVMPITAVFSEAVNVDTTGGTPTVDLIISGNIYSAAYASGSGTSNIIFNYTAAGSYEDLDGIDLGSIIKLNGGTILTAASGIVPGLGIPNTHFPGTMVDTIAPGSPSIMIAGGAANVLNQSVSLTLSATGAPAFMYITNTVGCATGGVWEAFNSSRTWSLAGIDSTQNVYVKFRDSASNESACVSDSIVHQSPASLSISAGTDYGNVTVGSFSTQTFTINNTGAVNATLVSDGGFGTSDFSFTGGSFPGTTGDCTGTIAPGTPCTIEVKFAPTVAGNRADTISISYNDGLITQTASQAVSGTGQNPALLTVSGADPFDFGTLVSGDTISQTFTLNNIGGVAATSISGGGLISPFQYSGGVFPGGGTCTATLNPGMSCTFTVTYSPPAVSPSDNSNVDISYFNGVAATNTLHGVTGISVAPASLVFQGPATQGFGNVAISGGVSTATLTLENTGGYQATNISDALLLTAPFQFVSGVYPGGGTCGATLLSGSTCTVNIEFTPNTIGTFPETVSLNYDDGVSTGLTVSKNLSGTGVTPANITISETDPYDFGSIPQYSTSTHIFTLTNGGTHGANITGDSTLSAPFRYLGGSYPGTGGDCPTGGLPGSGSTCTIVVEYAPTIATVHSSTITIDYFDGALNQSATRSVVGTATPANPPFNYLALGNEQTCGKDSIGNALCWGRGTEGQLGDGNGLDSMAAVTVSSITNVTSLDSFTRTVCAVDGSSNGHCWGDNTYGQIGSGVVGGIYSAPYTLPNAGTWAQLTVGNGHVCARKSGGAIQCWGRNIYGQLGNGTTTDNANVGTQISGGGTFIHLDAGAFFTCAVKSDNTVWCWGQNTYGQLGNSSVTNSSIPVQSSLLGTGIVKVAAGGSHACSLDGSGNIRCVGRGTVGQLGNGNGTDSWNTTANVIGSFYDKVVAGQDHTCAKKSDNTLWCWGSNSFGQLGDGTGVNSNSPVQIGTAEWADVFAGYNHTCGIKTDNTMWCWGNNLNGQLGDGTQTDQYAPTQVNP